MVTKFLPLLCFTVLCYVVGSRRLMPPDALQPKAYCRNPGLWSLLLAPTGVCTRDPSSERRNLDRKLRLPRIHFRVLLHAANMRHWTNGFTSLPKEGVLRIFFALKNLTASAGFEPANLGTKGQHATCRRPKPRTYITATCFGMNIARSVSA